MGRGRMTICRNGHHYDTKIHNKCPYCSGSTGLSDVSDIILENNGVSLDENKKTKIWNSKPIKADIVSIDENYGEKEDNGRTVFIGHTRKTESKEEKQILLAGWLVIVSEQQKGKHYPLTFGINNIGRDTQNHISIDNGDSSISRKKHSIVIYDYANNLFFFKHSEGQFLSYLNGSVVLDTKELKAYDKIKVGNTELIFVPLCNEKFKWNM